MKPGNLIFKEDSSIDGAILNDWHVVGFSHELEAGKLIPVRLLGRDLVMWRQASGEAHIWEDLCMHRGARLSKGYVKDDQVVCPYHGWRYDGTSKCTLIPSTPDQAVPPRVKAFEHKLQEKYGFIWASIGDPQKELPSFPEWGAEGYRNILTGPHDFNANGYRALENFCDVTHFPFVHGGLNGVESDPDPIGDYQVFEENGSLYTTPVTVFQPQGDPRRVPVQSSYSFSCLRPLVATLRKQIRVVDPEGNVSEHEDDYWLFFTAQPVDETHCIARVGMAMNFGNELLDEQIRARQELIFEQDIEIVETQRPERIPVDLRAEMHHRVDKLSVQYRKWLKDMGVTYGTIDNDWI